MLSSIRPSTCLSARKCTLQRCITLILLDVPPIKGLQSEYSGAGENGDFQALYTKISL